MALRAGRYEDRFLVDAAWHDDPKEDRRLALVNLPLPEGCPHALSKCIMVLNIPIDL